MKSARLTRPLTGIVVGKQGPPTEIRIMALDARNPQTVSPELQVP